MDNKLIHCTSCKGRKVLLGLGGFEKQCGACNGIGWTEIIVGGVTPEKKTKAKKAKKEEA